MGRFILEIIAALITILIMGVLIALPVMLLWNLVIPQLFGLSSITFLQALWLSLLVRFLVGGFYNGKEKD